MPATKTRTQMSGSRSSSRGRSGDGMSKMELMEKARQAGIKGRSSMNKGQLEQALKKG